MFDYTPLRVLMAHKGLKWKYINYVVVLHTTVTAKINKNEYISGDSLDRICQHFKCRLNDIVEIKKNLEIPRSFLK